MTIRISGKDRMNGKYSVECDDCYKVKDQLKQAGYIWNPISKVWMVRVNSTTEAMDKVAQLFEMGIADKATFEDLWTWAWTHDNDVRDLMDEAWQTRIAKALHII